MPALKYLTVQGVPTPGAFAVTAWASLFVYASWPQPTDMNDGSRPVSPSRAVLNAARTALVLSDGTALKVPGGVLVKFEIVGTDNLGTNYQIAWTQMCPETALNSGVFNLLNPGV